MTSEETHALGMLSRICGIAGPVLAAPTVLGLSLTSDEAAVLLGVATSVIVVVIWLVRLEGRVNLQEQRHADYVLAVDVRLKEHGRTLEKIDRKLDRVIGARALAGGDDE